MPMVKPKDRWSVRNSGVSHSNGPTSSLTHTAKVKSICGNTKGLAVYNFCLCVKVTRTLTKFAHGKRWRETSFIVLLNPGLPVCTKVITDQTRGVSVLSRPVGVGVGRVIWVSISVIVVRQVQFTPFPNTPWFTSQTQTPGTQGAFRKG